MAAPVPPAAFADLVRGVHHTAFAVPDLDAALAIYRDTLGFACDEPEDVPSQKVRVVFCFAGPNRLELVQPTSPDSAVARFLEKRGQGLHHVAFEVADVARAIEVLEARGVEMIDRTPRPGAHRTTVAFVHPRSASGVLVELVQPPADAASH
ncbi:MAG: methylmalonyl-CoA epimerase [Planctomycetota bacterium]